MAKPKDGKVFAKVQKADDLEVHVRYRKVEGEEFADIRDFVPSTKTYGRGILIPVSEETLAEVVKGLVNLGDANGLKYLADLS